MKQLNFSKGQYLNANLKLPFSDLANLLGHLGAGWHRYLRRLGRPDRVRHPEVRHHHGDKSSCLCFKFTGKWHQITNNYSFILELILKIKFSLLKFIIYLSMRFFHSNLDIVNYFKLKQHIFYRIRSKFCRGCFPEFKLINFWLTFAITFYHLTYS